MEKLKIYKYNYSSFQSIFELSGNNVPFIAGPCSIEDENQLERVAVTLNKNNVKSFGVEHISLGRPLMIFKD